MMCTITTPVLTTYWLLALNFPEASVMIGPRSCDPYLCSSLWYIILWKLYRTLCRNVPVLVIIGLCNNCLNLSRAIELHFLYQDLKCGLLLVLPVVWCASFLLSTSSSSSLGVGWFLYPVCVIQFMHTSFVCFFSPSRLMMCAMKLMSLSGSKNTSTRRWRETQANLWKRYSPLSWTIFIS